MRSRAVGLIVVIALLSLSIPALADVEAVQTGYGSMIIGGVFQTGFTYHWGNERLETYQDANQNWVTQIYDRESKAEFFINFARINFKGSVIDEKVRYFVQLELASEDNQDVVHLLDMKIGLQYIPYTTLWIGRFAPDFTYFNPMNVAKLGLVDFPLMNQFLGVQRQTGIEASIDHKWFEFSLGATNGMDFSAFSNTLNPTDRTMTTLGNVDWGEENTMKDIYVSLAAKPVDGMRIWGGYWWGNPLDYFEQKSDGELKAHHVKTQLFNGGFAYSSRVTGLSVIGELFYSKLKYDNDAINGTARDEDFVELRTMSYYGRLGFNMKPTVGIPLEFIGQYDWIDPDTENDKDTHGNKDELIYITGGINYYIKDWYAVFMVNYLYKDEQFKVLQMDGSGNQTGFENDELKFQVQVAF